MRRRSLTHLLLQVSHSPSRRMVSTAAVCSKELLSIAWLTADAVTGIKVVVVAQLGLAAVALGPSRAVKLGFQAILLAAASRSVVVLAKTLPQKVRMIKPGRADWR